MQRQIIVLGAAVAGLGLGVAGRLARAALLPAELVSMISLADSTPAVRHRLESWLGHPVTEMRLAAGNALAQGLTQGPFGLLVDIAYRGLLLDELPARRNVWRQREPELHDRRSREPVPTLTETAGKPIDLARWLPLWLPREALLRL